MMDTTEDRAVTLLALTISAALGWNVVAHPTARPTHRRPPAVTLDPGDARILAIAQAIAVAEGYYASGQYGGHSLPYRLNNPGGLKKPALGATILPTWKDTGLVLFPTREMGWAALHHQIRLMLSGDSTIYDPSDSLRFVSEKYADGDLNWGENVAAGLGVSSDVTLDGLEQAVDPWRKP